MFSLALCCFLPLFHPFLLALLVEQGSLSFKPSLSHILLHLHKVWAYLSDFEIFFAVSAQMLVVWAFSHGRCWCGYHQRFFVTSIYLIVMIMTTFKTTLDEAIKSELQFDHNSIAETSPFYHKCNGSSWSDLCTHKNVKHHEDCIIERRLYVHKRAWWRCWVPSTTQPKIPPKCGKWWKGKSSFVLWCASTVARLCIYLIL